MDLKEHLLRSMAFSHATYGPGKRTKGLQDHIRKELTEVSKAGGAKYLEWVDVVILALDGLTRDLAFNDDDTRCEFYSDPVRVADRAIALIRDKQGGNETRTWPDWRTSDPNKAIEHVKSTKSTKADDKLVKAREKIVSNRKKRRLGYGLGYGRIYK